MMNKRKVFLGLCIAVCGVFNSLWAQDKLTVNGRADFVSNYIWRGSDQNSGFSVQPYLSMSYKGWLLSANGSQSLTNAEEAPQEFDLNLGYSYKGLSLMVSDYWWNGMNAPYGHYRSGHHSEATVGFNFHHTCGFPLTLSWSTWFAGEDDYRISSEGRKSRAYSTYLYAAYDLALPFEVTLTPAVGFTPWEGVYHRKAAFTDISLKACKAIELNNRFSVPLFVQVVVAPHDASKGVDKTYIVCGFSLGF